MIPSPYHDTTGQKVKTSYDEVNGYQKFSDLSTHKNIMQKMEEYCIPIISCMYSCSVPYWLIVPAAAGKVGCLEKSTCSNSRDTPDSGSFG